MDYTLVMEFFYVRVLEEAKLCYEKNNEGLSRINAGLEDCLYIGNLDAKRDWGHAKDYVYSNGNVTTRYSRGLCDFYWKNGICSKFCRNLCWELSWCAENSEKSIIWKGMELMK